MKKNKENKECNTQTVFIPKLSRNDDALFVAVNGRRILVKKGEAVELPAHFAEVINNSVKAEDEAKSFIDSAVRDI